jgi:Domain of unknown function (DUF4442)
MRAPPIQFTASRLQSILNWWPPFWGAGIRVVELHKDFRYARVQMPLRWYNQNYVGVHFGGSLYAMCDPFYMLLLINVLNNSSSTATNSSGKKSGDFIVWDKAASIEYVKPGIGTMTAEFRITDEILNSIYAMKPNTKQFIDLTVNVTDEKGDIVAKLIKTEYVKRKPDETAVDGGGDDDTSKSPSHVVKEMDKSENTRDTSIKPGPNVSKL